MMMKIPFSGEACKVREIGQSWRSRAVILRKIRPKISWVLLLKPIKQK